MFEQIDVEKILTELKEAAKTSSNEEEFKIKAERILHDEVISKLGLKSVKYEYKPDSGSGLRADALYGHVIIEYKAPGKLSKRSDVEKAKEQIIKYIEKIAGAKDKYEDYLGVILSDRIAFVRYNSREGWVIRGPYDLNWSTVRTLIEALRWLGRKKKLSADQLINDFGSKSLLARKSVKVFYEKITKSKNPKVQALFDDWRRVFSQTCAYSPEKLKGLEAEYGITGQVDYSALLFAIQTYYALIMKLLAAEIAYLYGTGKWVKSYVSDLEDAYMRGLDAFKASLEELESGGVFRNLLGIINFIEGDYFSWYLEELDKELADVIAEIAKTLANYEPATPILEPEYTRDLLKKLYQNLVPGDIRRNLGEYYTPDWLAELVLNEAGLTVENFEKLAEEKGDPLAPLNLRILDPACGSGTFLVLVLKRLREYAEKHYLNDVLASYVLKNIVGFDLNPLAVLAARTNYLLAIADLLPRGKSPIEIPVYLADSLFIESMGTLVDTEYIIRTSVGDFKVPKSIIDRGLLGKLLEAIDKYVRQKYDKDSFMQVAKRELNLSGKEPLSIVELYRRFLKLEKEGRNHVWASIIRNAFAPLVITGSSEQGRFDYVIGNPPWVNWENLPEEYRERTKSLWQRYGLIKGAGRGLGRVKRDISMLFLARSLELYVKNNGLLAFLMPFTVFKTQAGAGFREFLYKCEEIPRLNLKCEVLKIHDLVELNPFEDATNRTSLIIVKKNGRTKTPIPCIMWHNPRSKRIEQDAELDEVVRVTEQYNLVFIPIKANDPGSPWMEIAEKAYEGIKKVTGSSPWYRAHAGVYTGLNQVYWIQILSEEPGGLLITNPPMPGRKKEVQQVKAIIEKDLVYPLVRGRDVKKWYVERELGYILVPVDENGNILPHSVLRTKYPKTYQYFFNFVNDLVNRGGEPYKTKLKPYREKSFEIAERIAPPFYWLFNVKPSLAPYKVVWKRISGKIKGKAVSFASAVLEPVKTQYFEKERPVILNDSLILIPFDNRDEAYYVSGVLNSSIALLAIASYTYELRQETHITQYLKIPKFNPRDPLHQKISDLSKKAHEIARKIHENKRKDLKAELKVLEDDIDKLVAQLYGITNEELMEIKRSLAILKGREVEEEEETEE